MECKYLKKIKSPSRHRKIGNEDDRGEFGSGGGQDGEGSGSMMWLCRYVIETGKGGAYGVRHCPYEMGPDSECLFITDEGGPYPPDKKE